MSFIICQSITWITSLSYYDDDLWRICQIDVYQYGCQKLPLYFLFPLYIWCLICNLYICWGWTSNHTWKNPAGANGGPTICYIWTFLLQTILNNNNWKWTVEYRIILIISSWKLLFLQLIKKIKHEGKLYLLCTTNNPLRNKSWDFK